MVNRAWFIVLILMGVSLLLWVIFCAVQMFRSAGAITVGLGVIGQIKCEKCHNQYQVQPAEFNKSPIAKSRSVTKTKIQGGALVNRPTYHYFAKKFYCPYCKKRVYGEVLNIKELQDAALPGTMSAALRWLLIMFCGGILILCVFGIPLAIL